MVNYQDVKEKRQKLGITQEELAKLTGITQTTISKGELRNSRLMPGVSEIMERVFNEIETKNKQPETATPPTFQQKRFEEKMREKPHLIPLYDDVSAIGGVNKRGANMQPVSKPTEYIDTGDWFDDADAAVRHYGSSMIEYPEGCILALKEVKERQLIVWGRNYIVETSEYRITKRLQRAKDEAHIMAYSSNETTYNDGQLINEPIEIAWNDISRIFFVLGYVVKQNGGTIVYNSRKK